MRLVKKDKTEEEGISAWAMETGRYVFVTFPSCSMIPDTHHFHEARFIMILVSGDLLHGQQTQQQECHSEKVVEQSCLVYGVCETQQE